jgi:hypothetical protein
VTPREELAELDLAHLRGVAEAASPGPWDYRETELTGCHDIVRWGREDFLLIYAECETKDAGFIATFDPPTVLALLDALAAHEDVE